ncbi:MAG: hypothetical protein AAGE52_15075 [Myxococcota bacterium]
MRSVLLALGVLLSRVVPVQADAPVVSLILVQTPSPLAEPTRLALAAESDVRVSTQDELSLRDVTTPSADTDARVFLILEAERSVLVVVDDRRDRVLLRTFPRVPDEDDILAETIADAAASTVATMTNGGPVGVAAEQATEQLRLLKIAPPPVSVVAWLGYEASLQRSPAHGPFLGVALRRRARVLSTFAFEVGYGRGSEERALDVRARIDRYRLRLGVQVGNRGAVRIAGRVGAGVNLIVPRVRATEGFTARSSLRADPVMELVLRMEVDLAAHLGLFVDLGVEATRRQRYIVRGLSEDQTLTEPFPIRAFLRVGVFVN